MAIVTTDMINKVISFTVYPSAIIGSNFDNVKLLSILDADTAISYGDVVSLHEEVYPTIPEEFRPIDDYRSYTYLLVRMANNSLSIVGLPWINGNIIVRENNVITVTINNVSGMDVEKVKRMCIANGYNDINVSIV